MAVLPDLLAGAGARFRHDPVHQRAGHLVEVPAAERQRRCAGCGSQRGRHRCRHRRADAHVLRVAERAAVGPVEQRVAAAHDPGVRGSHRERGRPDAVEFGSDLAPPAPRRVGLVAEFGLGAAVRRERVGVGHRAAGRGVRRRRRHDLQHRGHRAAGDAAGEGAQHQVGLAELARAVLGRPLVQRIRGEIRRDGIESAGVHDACAVVGRLLVVQIDAVADEHRLAGEIGVVRPRRRARGDQRKAVLGVRPHGGDDDLGAPRHLVERRGRAGVGGDERPVLGRGGQCVAHRAEFVGGTPGEGDARRSPDLGQILGRQLADEAGRAVQDDVEFTLFCGHELNLPVGGAAPTVSRASPATRPRGHARAGRGTRAPPGTRSSRAVERAPSAPRSGSRGSGAG